ncbi:MAG: DUF262 domain-containing protein [bacterium]
MKIIRNTMVISELNQKMETRELKVNRNYQRSSGLWPINARTYFIDTILNDFPFPKIILKDVVDLKTKSISKEIIDGQQRLSAIKDFSDNKFKLTSASKDYAGLFYKDLEDRIQNIFLSYDVSIDLIKSATDEEILEIFRRINSYTVPLNEPEKRHAQYQGEFKWFINNLSEKVRPFLEQYNILSIHEISRMMDADLVTEFCQLKIDGVVERKKIKLDSIYKRFDKKFENKNEIEEIIMETFNFLKNNFYDLFENFRIKSYNLYSLVGALIFNKFGIPDAKGDLNNFRIVNNYCNNVNSSREKLIIILNEVEQSNINGTFANFVKATKSATQSYKNRIERIKTLIEALQAE